MVPPHVKPGEPGSLAKTLISGASANDSANMTPLTAPLQPLPFATSHYVASQTTLTELLSPILILISATLWGSIFDIPEKEVPGNQGQYTETTQTLLQQLISGASSENTEDLRILKLEKDFTISHKNRYDDYVRLLEIQLEIALTFLNQQPAVPSTGFPDTSKFES